MVLQFLTLILSLIVAIAAVFAILRVLRLIYCYRVVVAGDAKLLVTCTKCGYSLAGLGDTPTCPECNTYHPTIYTNEPRTVWRFRKYLIPTYLGMAATLLTCWACISILVPPTLSALIYWSRGWEASGRVRQVWVTVYDWGGPSLIGAIIFTWLAGCVAALFLKPRHMLIPLAAIIAIGLSVTIYEVLQPTSWTGDWFNYFWRNKGEDVGDRIICADIAALCIMFALKFAKPNASFWTKNAAPITPRTSDKPPPQA